jgi:hypothetical protein
MTLTVAVVVLPIVPVFVTMFIKVIRTVHEDTRKDQEVQDYLHSLDAEADGADWDEVSLIVLGIDPVREPARARRAWESHLARAKWMTEQGYQFLLRG